MTSEGLGSEIQIIATDGLRRHLSFKHGAKISINQNILSYNPDEAKEITADENEQAGRGTPRHEEARFAVYYNKMNPHVTVHRIGCRNLGKHGGVHVQEQGGYGYFVEEYEATEFADSLCDHLRLPSPKQCSSCSGTG